MNRKNLRKIWRRQGRGIILVIIGLALLGGLLLHRLGLLTGGVSAEEVTVAHSTAGWHGLYSHPLYLPLEFVRSVVYYLFPKHGALLIRLPSVVFGGLAVIAFGVLIKLWHGNRTALFSVILFATSAWTLHVSRLAGSYSLYLLAIPALLLLHVLFQRYSHSLIANLLILFSWSLLLTVPGLIWLCIWSLVWQKAALIKLWQSLQTWWQRTLAIVVSLIWLPAILLDFWHHPGDVWTWLGAPSRWSGPLQLVKNLGQVFVRLFWHGPQQPDLWLGRLPILDVFTLFCSLLGIYFYIRNYSAARSRVIAGYFVIGAVLLAVAGPVSLGVLVPLMYVLVATGITYLLHEWLAVFPVNPIARNFGIGVITVAVAVSAIYNTRAYFVAWPANPDTRAAFNRHL